MKNDDFIRSSSHDQKVVEAEGKSSVAPTPKPTPAPTPTPKKIRPSYLWALAWMPLVLIGLWLGLRDSLASKVLSGRGREGVYRVGDYYDDGTKQGVVFEVSADGRHGKIVSLMQSEEILQWCSGEEYKRKIATGATDEESGMNNQRKIQQNGGWRENYPAFKWCADQGEDWYLPSIAELKLFTLNSVVHDAVNRTLQAKGATRLFDAGESRWYWSSTEDGYKDDEGWKYSAWNVYMGSRNTSAGPKIGLCYVRAVSTF